MSGIERYFWSALAAAALVLSGCGDDDGTAGGGGEDASVAMCGNGVVEGAEQCDDGNPQAGDGCEVGCTFTCDENADCNDGDSCDGDETCNIALHRCQAGTPRTDGEACTYFVQITADGGLGGEWMPVVDAGVCISQVCGRPCTMPSDCDDGDVCNGVETCGNGVYPNNCAPGAAPNCNDGLDCTIDSCDPVTSCANVLIDGDMDGFADDDIACDGRGGDCDDTDNVVYPGAADLCDDGKDNDCDGYADTADPQQPTWYQDCDGDGYAALGAVNLTQCQMPATTPVCASWTTVTPVGTAYTDCDDTLDIVLPGAVGPHEGFFTRPYCRLGGAQATGSYGSFSCASSGGTLNWDYDCSGGTNYLGTATNNTCSTGGFFGCAVSGGWTGAGYPGCAGSGEWSDCYDYCTGLYGCFPLACAVSSTYTKTQGCR